MGAGSLAGARLEGARTVRAVTALAAAAGMPVLIARERNSRRAIVAATDLRSTTYPVPRLAAALQRCLNVPIVTVHNLQPTSIVVGTGVSGPSLILLPPNPGRAARLGRLTSAAARLLEQAQPVLRDEASVVDAILDEARRNDAGLVVVGARKHPRPTMVSMMRSASNPSCRHERAGFVPTVAGSLSDEPEPAGGHSNAAPGDVPARSRIPSGIPLFPREPRAPVR